MNNPIKPDDIEDLPTLCTGQCCDLKSETRNRRVWLCRVAGGVTVEALRHGRWETVSGSCSAAVADRNPDRY